MTVVQDYGEDDQGLRFLILLFVLLLVIVLGGIPNHFYFTFLFSNFFEMETFEILDSPLRVTVGHCGGVP